MGLLTGKRFICDVWVQDERILVEAYNADKLLVQYLVREIPMGSYAPTTRIWSFPLSMATAARIHDKLLEQGRYHQSFAELVYGNRQSASAAEIKDLDGDAMPDIPGLSRPAWGHQRKAYAYMRRVLGLDQPTKSGGGGSGLFADMGTGKTAVTLGVIINSLQIQRVLLVVPKKVIEQNVWTKEIQKTILPELRPRVYPLEGSTAERAEIIRYTNGKPGIFLINYDALVYDNIQAAILAVKWDLVVLDEAHKIKAPAGKTSRFMAKLGTRVRFRAALTGTPNADKPLDVYGIYRFLEPTIFGINYNNFKARYAIMGGYMGREIKDYQNLDDLSNKMYSIAFRVTKDVLDLPEIVPHVVRIPLSPKARKAYDSMKKHMVYAVANGSATVSNTLTKIVRLQQITSGYLPVDVIDPDAEEDAPPKERMEFFETDKADALAEIIDDMPAVEPLIVYARFYYDLEQIKRVAQEAGRPYMEVSGRKSQLREWDQNLPQYRNAVVGVQITAGGAGVDFTRACYCVYYSVTHSLTTYDQSLSRVHRPGQERTTHYYWLLVSNSIDVEQKYALAQKKKIAVLVLDGLRQGSDFDAAGYTDEELTIEIAQFTKKGRK